MKKLMIGFLIFFAVVAVFAAYMRSASTKQPNAAAQYLEAQQAKRDARADRQERMEHERLVVTGQPVPMTDAEKAEQLAAQKAESRKRIALASAAEDSVKRALKDPDSADFKDQSGPCGYVNYKNGFGGYVGFRRYVAAGSAVAIEGENMRSSEMDKTWAKVCG